MPKLICSAIQMSDGTLFKAKRHHEAIIKAKEAGWPKEETRMAEQGFITDDGEFLDRIHALAFAVTVGQITGPILGSQLTSEDLW